MAKSINKTFLSAREFISLVDISPKWENGNKNLNSVIINGVEFQTYTAVSEAGAPDNFTRIAMLVILNGWFLGDLPLDPYTKGNVDYQFDCLKAAGFKTASIRLTEDGVFMGFSSEYWRLFNNGQYTEANVRATVDADALIHRKKEWGRAICDVLDIQDNVDNRVIAMKRKKTLCLLIKDAEDGIGKPDAISASQIKEWKKELAELMK